jgi:predicted O-linked N-acetylglucosamine transferase (SPINDLY family)
VTDINKALGEARRLIDLGNFSDAIAVLEPMVKLYFEAAMLTGIAANRAGMLVQAVDHFVCAIRMSPKHLEARLNLALTLRALGRNDEAEDALRSALDIDGQSLPVNLALGNLTIQKGSFEESRGYLSAVLAIDPLHIGALNNLGISFTRLGQLNEASANFEKVMSVQPDNVSALANLGAIRSEQGRTDEAIDLLRRVVMLAPEQIEAANNLGVALLDKGRVSEAAAVLRSLIVDGRGGAEVLSNLGNALVKLGEIGGAGAAYEQALALSDNPGIRIKRALLLPVICASLDAMEVARLDFEQRIDALIKEPPQLIDPFGEVGVPTFNLSYQDHNNRNLLAKLSDMYLAACPSLEFVAPHCADTSPRDALTPVRIGFVSRFFQSNSVGRCFQGVLRYPNRADVEVTAFTFTDGQDPLWEAIEGDVANTVILPAHLEAARQRIVEEALDVLVYTDIGMDPLTYYLAYSRLAPLQCVLGGHPDATGLSNIDAYISCNIQEPVDAAAHYRASLVRLPGAPTYYDRPELPMPLKLRSDFGLPEGRAVYFCGQTLIKIHPNMDELFSGILEHDPDGVIVLPEGYTPELAELLRQRFRRTIPQSDERIRFLPAMSHVDYLNVMALVDVSLDSRPFGGGNTSWQAIAVGTPMVTWPGNYLRGRYTQALYRLMGIDDAIVYSAADFIARAVRFGTDASYTAAFSARVDAATHLIFEDRTHVDSLYSFLVRRVRTGL